MLTLTSGRFVERYYITHFESDPTLVSVREIRVSRLGLCIWYSDWRFPRVSSAPSHICRASTKFKPRPLPNALQSIIRQSYKYISTLCTLQYWQRLQNAYTHTHTHTDTHIHTHKEAKDSGVRLRDRQRNKLREWLTDTACPRDVLRVV